MKMVIENEELNFIVLSQFYSIIDCYVFFLLLFSLILIVIPELIFFEFNEYILLLCCYNN